MSQSAMKTVAIIGAGPSGIVAAKVLTHTNPGQFKVHIFEKTSDVGGLWAVYKDRPYDGMLNPDMPTNLSRFNIGFSDLAWSSVGLDGHVPYWPKAWQVGQYVREYVKRWISPDTISFNTKVRQIDAEKHEGKTKWRLKLKHANEEVEQQKLFDHVVLASGYFGASSMPDVSVYKKAGVKTTHSTKLRRLEDIAPDDTNAAGTLIVVGGGMSGADVSTLLATQLSNAWHGPSDDGVRYSKLKLMQVCPAAAYGLPLAAPLDAKDTKAPTFLPLDLAMYDLGQRPPGDIQVGVGKMPRETIKVIHQAFQSMVGDQSELKAPVLKYSNDTKATYATLTEHYSGMIRSGVIEVVAGRVNHVSPVEGAQKVKITVEHNGETQSIEDVVGVVFATGFTPTPSLEFLDPETQKALHYDPTHYRLPIILEEHAALSQAVPGLAVIGFHEGAFWGSMEMEARLVEKRWRAGPSQSEEPILSEEHKTTISTLQALRTSMIKKEDDVPQYWLGDYVGLLETIAREVGIQRNDLDLPRRSGPITGARYTAPTDDQTESKKILDEYSSLLTRSKTSALFVGRATFLALQGHWTISRKITSFLPSMPSGTLSGTASFHVRLPTDPIYDFEYLYLETGTFTMSNGLVMQANKQYVYRYQESSDQITVWFVKPDGKTVDYLYHDLAFDPKDRRDGWKAKASHLCVRDMYESKYQVKFKGANIETFGVTHVVKGPKKDYISETWYVR